MGCWRARPSAPSHPGDLPTLTGTSPYRDGMGQLAEAFVKFLGQVHRSHAAQTEADRTLAEHGVTEAAKDLMSLYRAYVPANPLDHHDESAAKLIEEVDDVEGLANYVIVRRR